MEMNTDNVSLPNMVSEPMTNDIPVQNFVMPETNNLADNMNQTNNMINGLETNVQKPIMETIIPSTEPGIENTPVMPEPTSEVFLQNEPVVNKEVEPPKTENYMNFESQTVPNMEVPVMANNDTELPKVPENMNFSESVTSTPQINIESQIQETTVNIQETIQPIYCPNCGNARENGRFCSNCGKQLYN